MKKILVYLLGLTNLGIILIGWWHGSSELFGFDTAAMLLALGRLTGLLAVFCVLLQFVLVGRAVWIEQTFGLDKLTRIHHLNGYVSLLCILLHPVLITFSYAMSAGTGVVAQYIDFITNYEDVLQAGIAVGLFVLIVVVSISIARKRLKYETWYFVHLLTYLAIILAFGHQLVLGGDFVLSRPFTMYWQALYIFVFGNLIVFRILRPLINFWRFRFRVDHLVQETTDATSVYITGRHLEKFRIRPGQFLILRFFAKGLWWQAHPFSLSEVPRDGRLRVTIKNSGDFTSQISRIPVGTPMLIDGPYGVFTAHPRTRQKFLFLAGGVGITPIRSLIEQLAPTQDVVLIYANKEYRTTIFRAELDDLARRYQFPVHYVMSDEPGYPGEKGRIDTEKLLRLVPDLREREVYLCGPVPMMKGVRLILGELGLPASRIHFEQFSL